MRTLTAAFVFALSSIVLVGCGRPFEPATPSGFVDMGNRYPDGEYRAATADGVVIGIRAFDNEPRGELAFWSKALENRMRMRGGYALVEKRSVKNRTGIEGLELRFGHDEEGQPFLYWVTLFITNERIYVIEAGGPKEEMEKERPRIEWAVESFQHF